MIFLFRDSPTTFTHKRVEQTAMASEIENNKLVTAPHGYLTEY